MPIEGSAAQPPKPDTSVKAPPQVKAASERAEELAKQAKQIREDNKAALTAESNVHQLTTPASAPTSGSSGVQITKFDPANPRPPDHSPGASEPPDNLEHQFNSLKGRYDRAADDNKRMASQIHDMQRLLAAVSNPPAGNMPVPMQDQGAGSGVRFTGQVATPRVTQKEVSEYGEDFIDLVGRRAVEANEPYYRQVAAELAQIKRQLGGVQQAGAYDARVRMHEGFDREVPNWQEINVNPEFLSWLNVPDPLSGLVRKTLLDNAYARNEGHRVTEFFKQFQREMGATPGFVPGGTVMSPQEQSASRMDLMSLAAPGRAKSGQTQVTPDKGWVAASEIKQFYSDASIGKYSGREEEYNRIQNEIFSAMKEGRIDRRR